MHTGSRNYRSLGLIWRMHADKVLMSLAIVFALALSSGLGAMLAPAM